MYKLANGQLLYVEKIVTPNQSSEVTTTVCRVIGYDSDVPIEFETIPEKEEQTGKIAELHYKDGQLVWVYWEDRNISDTDVLGAELTKLELVFLDLKKQVSILGSELVKKDLSIFELTMQNKILGQSVSALELQVLAIKGGQNANV